MAIFIKITFKSKVNNMYYYEVNTDEFSGAHCLVSINPDLHQITFFDSFDLNKILKKIDLTNEEESIEVPSIHPGISGRVISKIIGALEKNEFPEDISWCS